MPKEKWKRRDEKLKRKREGMRVSGRSIFTIQEVLKKRAEQVRKSKRKAKRKVAK